ncbi:unnamed protein product, partial [Nesidiocoris tenuis]
MRTEVVVAIKKKIKSMQASGHEGHGPKVVYSMLATRPEIRVCKLCFRVLF